LCRKLTNERKDQVKKETVGNVQSNTLPSLEQILQRLGLENFILTFQMEQIDGEALVG
jgi:anti-anti-sigma regulatory factor